MGRLGGYPAAPFHRRGLCAAQRPLARAWSPARPAGELRQERVYPPVRCPREGPQEDLRDVLPHQQGPGGPDREGYRGPCQGYSCGAVVRREVLDSRQLCYAARKRWEIVITCEMNWEFYFLFLVISEFYEICMYVHRSFSN